MTDPARLRGLGISAREAEVLALLGEHLTNAEIATQLFISVRTAESHVASLLRKLGAPDRRALAAMVGATPTASAGVFRLPTPLGALVGRQAELDHLLAAARGSRLVTLVGPGGAGKTRLAVEAAHRMAESHPEGAWFADLAPLRDPQEVPRAVTDALGLVDRISRSPQEAVTEYLRHRKALLVLDNCEHLVDACAHFAATVTASCGHLRVIATSREPLDVPGEVVVPIGGLDARAAVQLFIAAATAGYPRFGGDVNTVDRVCSRLDRLPLAIELAAARVASVTLDELEATLADGRAPLRTTRRGTDLRHRSLADVIAWSVDLLDDDERHALAALAVFAGSFPMAAAEAVIGTPAAAKAVDSLLRRSLLSRENDVAGQARFRMLETVRQFVAGLDETASAAARQRHRDFHLQLAEDASAGLRTAESPRWMARLRASADDLRAAADDACSAGPLQAARLAAALAWPWVLDGKLAESQTRIERALAAGAADPLLRARLRFGLAVATIAQGDLERTTAAARALIADAGEAGDDALAGHGYQILGMAAWARGDHSAADAHHRTAVRYARRLGDGWVLALVCATAGRSACAAGDVAHGAALLAEATAIAEKVGDPMVLASALDYTCAALLEQGRLDEAAELAERSLSAYRMVGYAEGISSGLVLAAMLAIHRDRWAAAEQLFSQALEVCLRTRHPGGTATALDGLGIAAAHRGDARRAAELLGDAERIRLDLGVAAPVQLDRLRAEAARAAEQALGGEFEAVFHRGTAPRPV